MADDDSDPVVPVVIGVIIILFLILCIRIAWYCLCGRESGNGEYDVEQLDLSRNRNGVEGRRRPSPSVYTITEDERRRCEVLGGRHQQRQFQPFPQQNGVLQVPAPRLNNGHREPSHHRNVAPLQPHLPRNLLPRPLVPQRNILPQPEPQRNHAPQGSRLQQNGVPPKQKLESKVIPQKEVFKAAIKHLEAEQAAADSKPERLKIIRQAQDILLRHEKKASMSTLQTTLIIGVDATPKTGGGYCVNLDQMRLDYYVIKMEDLPWPLEAENNSSEFEMKNLMFAVATWSKLIRRYKNFRIYTDNHAIESDSSHFGLDAKDLLEHLTDCENVKQVNQKEHINRTQDLEGFAKYIQPADDFSRWEMDQGIDFLCGFYEIDKANVHGTWRLMRNASPDSKPWYNPTPAYQQYITRAETFAKKFSCQNCNIDAFALARHSPGSNGGRVGNGNRNLRRLQQTPRNVLGQTTNGNKKNGGGGNGGRSGRRQK